MDINTLRIRLRDLNGQLAYVKKFIVSDYKHFYLREIYGNGKVNGVSLFLFLFPLALTLLSPTL